MDEITRRGLLGTLAAGLASSLPILGAGCGKDNAQKASAQKPQKETASMDPKPAFELPKWKKEDFYTADGKFNPAAAKQACYTLMEYHHFPILPVLKTDEFWTLDFSLDNFLEVGMGGVFYVNNQKDNYLLHDIWLLPGQMIPEHYHVKTPEVAAKMEAWLVRHGSAYFYSEGEPTPGVDERIPPLHKECAKARHEVLKKPGDVVVQPVPEARHWMRAGPAGAIVTEVATYHDMAALRFSHPKAKV